MKYSLLSLVLCCFLFLVSCSKEENPVQPQPSNSDMLVLSEKTDKGIKMQLLAADTLEPGYNKLYIKLTKVSTGEIIRNARIRVALTADQGMDSHSSPVEQPAPTASGDVFPFGTVFVEFGTWTFDIEIDSEAGEPLSSYLLVPVSVKYVPYESGRIGIIVGTDGKTYIISMECLCKASVGANDIVFTVHSTDDLASYSPVEDLSIIMTPSMPSTGQGSTNNVNPVHTTLGHYKGVVNFTATGEWQIAVDLKRGSETLASTYFTVTL